MEVEIDLSEENQKKERFVDFLTKVTLERIGEHKYIVRFEGQLYKYKLQVGDVIGFLLWHWYMATKENKEIEKDAQNKDAQKGYAV